jgi:hypothetical protein
MIGVVSIEGAQADAFYVEALADHSVWGIRDSGGCPAPMTPDGHRAMPFWSKHSRAARVVENVAAYNGFEPFEISLVEWRSKWLPGLDQDGLRVGLNWSGQRAVGFDLPVQDLLRNLAAREPVGSTGEPRRSLFRRRP